MGGGFSSYSPPPPPNPVKVKAEEFYAARDPVQRQTILLDAYKAAEKEGDDLVNHLLSAQGKKIVNSIKEIEIEMKLTVPAFTDGSIAKTLAGFTLPADKQNKFLKCAYAVDGKGINHYFGTPTEERFIAIQNDHGWHLKNKGQSTPYTFGVPGEEFVLRRSEVLKSGSEDILSFIKSIVQGCQSGATVSIGSMDKHKVTCHTLERTTGRVYAVTLGLCTAEKREPLHQLEIEYAGYIPNFSNQKIVESERKILEDILEMAGMFEQQGLKPTTLTKFEWLIGKPEPVPEKKEEKPAAKPKGVQAGQSMFGESLE